MNSLSAFDYSLPKELIAQEPLPCRDSSKLLVIKRKTRAVLHRRFTDILEFLSCGDCLVLNDTRVVPARIFGRKKSTGGKVELLLLERKDKYSYKALVKPKLRLGEEILFDGGLVNCKVIDKTDNTGFVLASEQWSDILSFGQMPLPPYIKRMPEAFDKSRYQTVYAKNPGAVAAPTAGLHFTERILRQIKEKGITVAELTLHVGYGTFKPIRYKDIREHKMELEYFSIPKKTAEIVLKTKAKGKKVVAVGTTTCRALETIAQMITDEKTQMITDICGHRASSNLRSSVISGCTDLFIYPPYRFRIVDVLLTNFHLPMSSLLVLVAAFAGRKLIFEAYRQAIERRYRFYSYGDSMLII